MKTRTNNADQSTSFPHLLDELADAQRAYADYLEDCAFQIEEGYRSPDRKPVSFLEFLDGAK